MDMLSGLLSSFAINAQVFHAGELCGVADFSDDHGVGHLHVIRHGRATVFHTDWAAIEIDAPSVLFYPRALSHRLVIPDTSVADVLCATISFSGGIQNPLARSLPDSLLVPLDEDRPVGTVALEVGYSSQPAFTKAFTRRVGMSPREWSKRAGGA